MKRFAPAKINLSLEILGKRSDGYHDLRSLFLPISLRDELEFNASSAFSFSCAEADVPSDESNLVIRAARLFGCGELPKVAIQLTKNIPHSAGLGGGSSDAATTLLTLNEMMGYPFSGGELLEMGAQIGSDVPFFLYRSAAWCEGRGEIVQPVGTALDCCVLLFKPPFGVPTPWAYDHLATSLKIPGIPYAEQTLENLKLVNHLERPVFQKYLLLALLKKWLLEQKEVEGALMSGSGSTMFALIKNEETAGEVREKMLAEFGPDNWTFIGRPYFPEE